MLTGGERYSAKSSQRLLGRRVGTDRLVHRVGLAERAVGAIAVDARAGGVDETWPRLEPTGALEQVHSPQHVDRSVQCGIFDAGTDSRPRGEMNDHFRSSGLDQTVHALGIANIELDQPTAWLPQGPDQIRSFDRLGGKRVEVIDDRDLGTVAQQSIDEVRADEASSPCKSSIVIHAIL